MILYLEKENKMKTISIFLLSVCFLAGCQSEFKQQLKAVEEILIANNLDPARARPISRTIDKKNVFSIGLENDSLRIIPDAIGRLTNIRYLNLNFNEIEHISEEIGNCTALVMIELVGNKLKRLPESLGNLRNLETLELRANQLEYLPQSIGNLQKLKKLTLQRNRLKELPESFGDLRIGTVSLDENELETLPESFGKLRAVEIYLVDNKIKVFPLKQVIPVHPSTYYGLAMAGNPIDPKTVPPLFKEKCTGWAEGGYMISRDKNGQLNLCHKPVDESQLILNIEKD
jgi:hypothetical protein